MKRSNSLKSKIDFNLLLKSGKKIHTSNFLISYKYSEKVKIGISIPKKLGNAVFRNKNKRRIKSALDNFEIKNTTMVIIAKVGIDKISFNKLLNQVDDFIKKINTQKRNV